MRLSGDLMHPQDCQKRPQKTGRTEAGATVSAFASRYGLKLADLKIHSMTQWDRSNVTEIVIELKCSQCQAITSRQDPVATSWDCACGGSYVLRRCAACGVVSQVSSLQRKGEPWACMWCQAANSSFTMRRDPAEATLGDLGADMASRGLVLPRAVRRQPEPKAVTPLLVVTTNEISGYRITAVHGDVFGLIVRARNYFGNLGASLRTVAGGEVAGYTKLLIDSRNQARERMCQEARARGANAVVAMRFDCNEIGDVMSEVAAYGTAVTVEPCPPSS
jgi:uncharacterized protein YbjQ (UPF0145 family)